MRRIFRFEAFITVRTFEMIAKTMILTCLIIGYSYGVEYFMAWYSGNRIERDTYLWRIIGSYGFLFWLMLICNTALPLLFFFKMIRTNLICLFVIAILVDIGMWVERFVIIVGSMAHDFDPYAWGIYTPRWVETTITIASFCLFFFFFLLFAKFLPSVSLVEIKKGLTPLIKGEEGIREKGL